MSSFETGFDDDHVGPGDILQLGPNTVVAGARRPVFFDRKEFNNAVREITQPDGDNAAQPAKRAPTTRKARAELRNRLIREFYNQHWPGGFIGRTKDRNKEIRLKFPVSEFGPLSDTTIRRALKPPKSD